MLESTRRRGCWSALGRKPATAFGSVVALAGRSRRSGGEREHASPRVLFVAAFPAPGTTERLHAWMRSLASCINAGAVSPRCAANILCVLDAPGTEVHPLAEAVRTWIAACLRFRPRASLCLRGLGITPRSGSPEYLAGIGRRFSMWRYRILWTQANPAVPVGRIAKSGSAA